MGESVGDIVINVGANTIGFVKDMGKAADSVDGLDKKTRKLIDTMAKTAAAAVAAGAAMVTGLYVTASENIDRQAKLARAINGTTASVQSLEYAADLAGVAHEEMAKASEKLNRKLGEAIIVGGSAAKELDRLGLSAKELSQMDANDRMAVIADRLVALHYNSAEAGQALKELGLKGNEMVAMMMDGGDQFRQANAELRELNVLVSDVDSSKIEAANDAWTRVKTIITGVANTIAVELSPYVQVVAEQLRAAAVESGGFKEQVKSAVEAALRGFGHFGDFLRGLHVVWKGLELAATTFGAVAISVVEAAATGISGALDGFVAGINLAIAASNKLLGTSHEFLSLPSQSDFMVGLHDAADSVRGEVVVLRDELAKLAMQQMPSDQVDKFLADVKKKSQEAAESAVNARKKSVVMPDENEETTKKKDKADNILDGVRAGTEGLRAELAKREEVLAIYRNNQLALDAPYYAQQVNDIKISEEEKLADIIAAAQKETAQRQEQRAQNLERVAEDKIAIAAINAEYDQQEILAEQIKQDQMTQVQQDAQQAREKLRYLERQNAISTALGLGQQLMQVTQGHSKKAFEISKGAAIASAVIDGYRSATAAWSAGMSTGGPWAPLVAAGYTAASLLKTGSLIQSIRSTSFNTGGGGGSSGGGAASGGGAPVAAGGGAGAATAPGPSAGSVMHVTGMDPNHLFTGSAVQTIANGLLQFQKDGGKVVFEA